MVNLQMGALPTCLISILTTFSFPNLPCSPSLYNYWCLFLNFLPSCLQQCPSKESEEGWKQWPLAGRLAATYMQHQTHFRKNTMRIIQNAPIGLSIQTKLCFLLNFGLDLHCQFKLSCQLLCTWNYPTGSLLAVAQTQI